MTAPADPPGNPSPLYAQMEEEVRDRIESGIWSPGTTLPSERDLCEEFGLSRATTRMALARLERAGLVRRIPRRGTIVLEKKASLKALSLQGFTAQVLEAGSSPTSKLLHFQTVVPTPAVADQLGIPSDRLVYSLERLRRVDGVPVGLHRSYLPIELAPGLEEQDLASNSLYTVLSRRYGIEISGARETLQSSLATNYESALLDVPAGAPMLQLSIVLSAADGSPVELVRVALRGDRVTLTSQI
ncbi:GntR family transcriptional regulator [Dactylosporangium roseum]|uniref:GntR family transcriptional regulator n=1 Tax=Dactylosporangium roseum TaxID=47989 RepID=A0ABY5ZBA7_9ACTN|nr:GntR family transcriptional regulator [Dactylosporangium roseum]UWZ39137.1 GntR family transcriptional regulator [Dactylosporangium roseum]